MTDYRNTLAWIGVALAILLWAFAPKLAWANTVYVPLPPKIETTILPLPSPSSDGADAVQES